MARLGLAAKALLTFGLAMRLRHHFPGSPVDYVGVTLAAVASWIGLPGPGEPVLITAGVFAARHKLDISSVILVAWLGATAGGIAGWWIGLKAGRGVLSSPGPLIRMRRRALARGDEVFRRYAVVAILLTPSWIAGIARVNTMVYQVTNAVSAAVWAIGIGLGAYFAGPPIVDIVDDVGLLPVVGIAVLVGLTVGGELWRRQRRRAGV
ncbi:MAG: DedA family protein [Solirubrobacteraceae bacterium]|jgi:membrane protein DedA with SNARE-associated domain